jgi:hypothetical protein
MKLSTFLAITGIIALLFGAFFLIAPELALKQYGMPTDQHNQLQSRFFGASLLQAGLVAWLARQTQDAIAVRAILIGLAVHSAFGAAIGLWAVIAKLQNAMAWSTVVIYVLLLLGAVYFLMSPSRQRAP